MEFELLKWPASFSIAFREPVRSFEPSFGTWASKSTSKRSSHAAQLSALLLKGNAPRVESTKAQRRTDLPASPQSRRALVDTSSAHISRGSLPCG
eukprot:1488163-Amphidinium_carterae.1